MTRDKNIRIRNIYYMISYAFRSVSISDMMNAEKENFGNIYNLFAAILSEGIGRQLKRGIYREYTGHCEDLSLMRGRLNMKGTMRNRVSGRNKLTCEYDDLSENNQMNRILKTTVLILIRVPDVDSLYKEELKKKMMFFSEVDTLDISSVRWNDLRYGKNNQSYQVLMGVCRLISESMIMTDEKGDLRIASFIDCQYMNILYGRFILEYYKKHFPCLSVSASAIPWSLDDGTDAMLPVMRSDITIRKGNNILIISPCYQEKTVHTDCSRAEIDSGDMFQIFTYVKNLEYQFGDSEHKVSGMILYARTDELLQPENDYNMKGNRISVRVLDLDQIFSGIAEQLDSIAFEYFGEKPSGK